MSLKFLSSILSLILIVSAVCEVKAAGEVDTSFRATAYHNDGTGLSKAALLPDGKILVAGGFTIVNGEPVMSIVRLNTDGNIDTQFTPPIIIGFAGPRFGGAIKDFGIQSDGKIVIAGEFYIGNDTYKNIARLNPDGTLDTTFTDLSARFTANNYITNIRINPDNSIIIHGSFTFSSGNSNFTNVAKLNSVGGIDFGAAITSPYPQVIVEGGGIGASVVQPDGKTVIVGGFTAVNGYAQGGISRINTDGSIDTTFNSGGIGANSSISSILLGADGKFFITGSFISYNNTPKKFAAKLNSDGTLDNSFVLDASILALNSGIFSPSIQSDGKILIGVATKVYRLNPDGSIDSSFRKTNVKRGGVIYEIVQQPDGKILAAGTLLGGNDIDRNNIIRYNLDGSIDTIFNQTSIHNSQFIRLAVQPDGKIIVVSGSGGATCKRLNADGSVDTTFQVSSAEIGDIEILPDGKILIGVRRFLATGGIDSSYNIPTVNSRINANKVLANGKYLIAGDFTQVNGVARGRIARLNNDGTLDTTFILPLGANEEVNDMDVQADGKIVLVGTFTGLNGAARSRIGRLDGNGGLDTNFTPTANGDVRSVKIQSDGKILIAGRFTQINGIPRNRYARLNADGSLDTTFVVNSNSDISVEEVNKITTQSDGKILIGGYFARVLNTPKSNIARLLNNATARTPFDFDGDGRADVSVFRPSTGYWYTSQNPALNYGAFLFGQAGDKPVPADYDGDGKTDVAVVRNGNWYLQRSSLGFSATLFGDSSDIPVPADYDGDGRADIAVFRPSNGTWYLLQSSLGFSAVALGLGTDKPVPADYNGDGRAEVAVFRPSNGYWYLSTNPATGYGGIPFGQAEDKPVPADYDGDGKTDIAVFRPSNGSWYLLQSTAGFTGLAFGLGTDLPTAADYDGDGRADIAVFRNGNWYLNRSTQGFTGIAFGTATDQPIPHSFVR